jgi:hypothetical protein
LYLDFWIEDRGIGVGIVWIRICRLRIPAT